MVFPSIKGLGRKREELERNLSQSESLTVFIGLPKRCSGKESNCNAGDAGEVGSIPGLGRSPG